MKHRVKLIVKTEKRGSRGLQGIYLRPQQLLVSSHNNEYRQLRRTQRVIDFSNEDLMSC